MWRIFLMLILIAVLVLGASIGYFNAQMVNFDYLFGSWEIPLIGLLIGAFALGVVLTLLVIGTRLLAQRLELGRLRARVRDHEIELRNLRNLSIAAEPAKPATVPAPTVPAVVASGTTPGA